MLTGRQLIIDQVLRGLAQGNRCEISLRELARRVGCSVNTLRADLKEMVFASWLFIEEGGYRSVFRLRSLSTDDASAQESMLSELRKLQLYLENAPYAGEALLKGILNVIVPETAYIDNARPSFLISPITGQPLEYDRYYERARVAVEFHGAQHDHPTELSPGAKAAHRQRVRDVIKLGLSYEQAVHVLVFRTPELSVERVSARVEGYLPLQIPDPQDPRIRLLNELCRRYRIRSVPALVPRPTPSDRSPD